jgi:beta-lactamase superfamily II metal-dependent hydrolase
MIDYGIAPAPNEIEVIIFGPGYGEAIAIHVGENVWALIDSCIDPYSGAPAQLTYLNRLGIQPSQVRTIVASHWHDDHVRGISKLAESFPDSEFIVSSVFDKREARAFLAAYSGKRAANLNRGTKELYTVIENRKVYFVHNRSIVFDFKLSSKQVIATALSPVQQAVAQSVAHFAKYIPGNDQSINNAAELTPNFESIAIHIDFGDEAILLGSDLEEHSALGWSALLSDQWSSQRRISSVYKVAHHGSESGDAPCLWTNFLSNNPVALMTPFIKGKHRIPTDSDKIRIMGYTTNAHISSVSTKKPNIDNSQLKRLNNVCNGLSKKNPGFGAVRIRKPFAGKDWSIEHFGNALQLQ